MRQNHKAWKGAWVAGACLILGFGGACSFDDLLTVDNPEQIKIEQLNNPRLVQVQLNGVMDAFSNAYTEPVIEWSNFLTDEVITGLNWEDYARVNQRIASYLEGPTAQIFEELSRSFRMGHDLSKRIRGWAADDPDTDFRAPLAASLAFSGYSALVLAENMCQAVISPEADNPSATILSQAQTFEAALPYLNEAVTVAKAAGKADVANLALTGLGRAYLGLGKWTEAANAARQVSTSFKWWMDFVDIDGGRNPLQNTSHGGNFTHGIHPSFMGGHPSFAGTGFKFTDNNVIAPQTDPRIQHEVTDGPGHNRLTRLYKLFQGLRYSEYSGKTIAKASPTCPNCTGTSSSTMPLIAEFATDIVLADNLEAQHHLHEALAMQPGNDAAVLAFVNARRAVGNQAAVTLTGQALRTELRNQRARDLFMGGFRLPDLRRWTRFDAGNGPFAGGSYFPTGQHPNAQWGDYGKWTCFPIPISEYEGNPNLTRPTNPNEPPGI